VRPFVFILALITAISLCGCAAPAENGFVFDLHEWPPDSAEAPDTVEGPGPAAERDAFGEFLDTQFEDYVTDDTITLHYTLRYPENLGIERIEPTLGEFGSEYFADVERISKEDFNTLKSFPYEGLSEEQKIAYDMLEYYFELDIGIFDEGMQYYFSMFNPVSGVQAELPILLAEYKFYDERDVVDYLALLNDVDRYFRRGLEFEREKSEKGLFMPDFAVDDIIESCNDFTAEEEDNFLIGIFDDKIEELGLTEDIKEEYKEENRNGIINDVIPAYRTLVQGLEELKGTGVNEGGLAGFDKGKQYYEYLIKSEVGSDESIESLIAMIEERMEMAMYGMGMIAYSNEAVLDLVGSPDFGSGDPEEIIEMLKNGMRDLYPENAGATHTLKTLHLSMESSFPAAFYLTVPIDDFSSAVIYINKGSMSDEDLFPILAHEGYPGHLYQDTYFKSMEKHPLRYALGSTGYVEGWAIHAEINAYMFADYPELGEEIGAFMGLDTEYRIAIQSRCDIGVNYEGWTQQDVRDYLDGLGISGGATSRSLYEYVVKGPAKTLRYYIGYLEIERLLDYAMSELGDAFSYKDFHKCILEIGPAPFFIIKNAVYEYVAFAKEGGQLSPAA